MAAPGGRPASGSGQSVTVVDPLAAARSSPRRGRGLRSDEVDPTRSPTPTATRGDDSDARRLTDLDRSTFGYQPRAPGRLERVQGRLVRATDRPALGPLHLLVVRTGAGELTLDGRTAVSDPVAHDAGTWSGTIDLRAGHTTGCPCTGRRSPMPPRSTSRASSTWHDLRGRAIAQAAAAARRSSVAVVFAADYTAETFDRPNLLSRATRTT